MPSSEVCPRNLARAKFAFRSEQSWNFRSISTAPPRSRSRSAQNRARSPPLLRQVIGEDLLRGHPHFPFFPAGAIGFLVGVLDRRLVRHAQVSADHVHDGLPVSRIVLRQPLKRVETGQPDRRLFRAELLDRLEVEVADTPLRGVVAGIFVGLLAQEQVVAFRGGLLLGRLLPPRSKQQRDEPTRTEDDRADGPHAVQPRLVRIGPFAVQRQQQPARRRGDDDQHDRRSSDRPVREQPVSPMTIRHLSRIPVFASRPGSSPGRP
ncbi:hypothetical protein [Amycolatopsis sp. lyj-109]|uniref:hypothetical protein n=1 Tax=Amycolatopsis sp. lyj-109 TaxID=2789287 RepID=UPI00397D9467